MACLWRKHPCILLIFLLILLAGSLVLPYIIINVNNKTTKNVAENFTNFDYLVCSSLLCGKMSFVR